MKAFKKHIIPFVQLVDSWNRGQQKNPHLSESLNESAVSFWQDMFRPGPIPKKYITQMIKKKGELPSKKHIKSIYRSNGNPSSSELAKSWKLLTKEKYVRAASGMWRWNKDFTGWESVDEAIKPQGYSQLNTMAKHATIYLRDLSKALRKQDDSAVLREVHFLAAQFTTMEKMLKDKKWNAKYNESVNEAGMGILDKDQTDVLHAIVMRNKNKNSNSILKIALKDRMFKGVDKKELLGYIEGARQFVKYMKSHPMESVNEAKARAGDYVKVITGEVGQINKVRGTLAWIKLASNKKSFWPSDIRKLKPAGKEKGKNLWTEVKLNESDLGLAYKKGKTVKVIHKSSGKELIVIDKPNVRKEYEKIGYFTEGKVNEGGIEWEKHVGKAKPISKKLQKEIDSWMKKYSNSRGGVDWSRVKKDKAPFPKESVKEDRDYKDEYKKFQSSTKAKKYRAELNKYNRQKGTYGNGDGKDASHKGGKIVGFEAQSKNRGRAEKSRLKKEARTINVEPNWEGVWRYFKYMAQTNPAVWKRMQRNLGSEWGKLEKMAQQKRWQSESVNEEIAKGKGVQKIFDIQKNGYGKLGGRMVDQLSAGLFTQLYDKAPDNIKEKMNKMNEKRLYIVIGKMWDKFGKSVTLR
jgi:hypothetical protein